MRHRNLPVYEIDTGSPLEVPSAISHPQGPAAYGLGTETAASFEFVLSMFDASTEVTT